MYIKKFEKFKNVNFVEINDNEYEYEIYGDDDEFDTEISPYILKIDKHKIQKHKKFLEDRLNTKVELKQTPGNHIERFVFYVDDKENDVSVEYTIYISEKNDEWYYVSSYCSDDVWPEKFYKCDQEDGLLNCLQELCKLTLDFYKN